LIHYPKEGNRPRLVEKHFLTEELNEGEFGAEVVKRTRQRSCGLALTREEVEADIEKRSLGIIGTDDEFAAAERL
jgi:hypothetical protein